MHGVQDGRLHQQLSVALKQRERKGSLRALKPSSLDHTLLDFSSNDYLDLASAAILRTVFTRYLEQQGTLASTGSRLLSGNSHLANTIEEEARAYWQSPEALLCGSGYEANVSLFSTIPQPGDVVLYDAFIHASVHVGLKTSRAARKVAFRHNDMAHLRSLLRHEASDLVDCPKTVFIACETVYSMDGDLCPLVDMLAVIRSTYPSARVILDEAHATGVFGPLGRGLASHLELANAPEILVRLHTFGKGAAGTGAIILCDALVKSYLLNYAKGLIYSTFLSAPALCLMRASLTALSTGQTLARQNQLWQRTRTFHALLSDRLCADSSSTLVVPSTGPQSPIIPILTSRPLQLSQFLHARGFRVMPVRYPTVPRDAERIRICLRAEVSVASLEALVDALADWQKLGHVDSGAVAKL
ncbi:8-amino-7-oxononanoate synthase [Protomyces lactucae-debilis]|uniref:8-amino-7-oxononanoate synthase n=1 Tax=Protomyces lactucae-debilis TaxID=2754530 RepID=A0A1Y2FQP2_PROLT|nr:8-amino-7-oxononanoate synthase [Protomyces lactucae-debilis]ORY85526.1 8-amino-7-oxononanoate synthase [Protomyces lactucae-debilis]